MQSGENRGKLRNSSVLRNTTCVGAAQLFGAARVRASDQSGPGRRGGRGGPVQSVKIRRKSLAANIIHLQTGHAVECIFCKSLSGALPAPVKGRAGVSGAAGKARATGWKSPNLLESASFRWDIYGEACSSRSKGGEE
jgi:hypothetical protein